MASGSAEAQFSEFINASTILGYLACISYGALCAQAYEYFLAFRDDSWFLKVATAAVMSLETLHVAITIHTLYHFTIVVADDPLSILNIPWDSGIIILVDTFVVLIVQIYYIRRIWILSNSSRALVALLGTIVCGRCGLELAVVAYLWSPTTSNYVTFRNSHVTFIVYICWMSFGALGDVLIAIAVGSYLVSKRTGFRSTDTIIRKAVALSINSGAITAAVAVAALITFLLLGSQNIVNNGLLVFASGLYANSFFGMLNARQIFRRNIDADSGRLFAGAPIVLRGPADASTSGFKSPANFRLEL